MGAPTRLTEGIVWHCICHDQEAVVAVAVATAVAVTTGSGVKHIRTVPSEAASNTSRRYHRGKGKHIKTVPPEAAATATSTTAPGANKDNRAKLMQSVVTQSDLKMYQTQALGS